MIRKLDFDEDFDERGVLRDRHSYRVPLQTLRMTDGNTARRAPPQQSRFVDGTGRQAGNRPGFVFDAQPDEDMRDLLDLRDEARDQYLIEQITAWQRQPGESHLDRWKRENPQYSQHDADEAAAADKGGNDFTEVSPQEFIAARERGNDPRTGFGERGERGPQVGSACTCKGGPDFANEFGSPGTWQMYKGRLTCVPNKQRADKRDARDIATMQRQHRQNMATIQDQLDFQLTNAWRHKDQN